MPNTTTEKDMFLQRDFRIEAVRRVLVDRAGEERRLLRARRTFRDALVKRKLHADLRQARVFLAHFNAGVRAIDIRDPFNPKEIGYYIPAISSKTDKRCVGTPARTSAARWRSRPTTWRPMTAATSTSSNRANTGMHILELTGAARKVARFPGTN